MTQNLVDDSIPLHCIPRLCNGSTSDSGSDCGGSSPPWGNNHLMVARSLRLSVRTKDSQSLKRGSIPLGTVKAWRNPSLFFALIGSRRCEVKKLPLGMGAGCSISGWRINKNLDNNILLSIYIYTSFFPYLVRSSNQDLLVQDVKFCFVPELPQPILLWFSASAGIPVTGSSSSFCCRRYERTCAACQFSTKPSMLYILLYLLRLNTLY